MWSKVFFRHSVQVFAKCPTVWHALPSRHSPTEASPPCKAPAEPPTQPTRLPASPHSLAFKAGAGRSAVGGVQLPGAQHDLLLTREGRASACAGVKEACVCEAAA